MNTPQPQIIVVQATKNPGTAALLGCLFGPIGLLYATGKGAIIMFFVNLVIGAVTFGFGLFLTWPICGLWGYKAAQAYNEKLISSQAPRPQPVAVP